MKLTLKIESVFLIFALLTSCVAATENKDLPTKEEITEFISGIPVSSNYIITTFDAVKEKHPAWNCDTWVDKNGNQILSLYYVDPDSAKGYGSIYFNELGKEISMLGVEASLVNHYVGEAGSEEQPAEEEAQPVEEENQPVEEETQPIKKTEQPAETENKDLPTKEEITYFIAGIPVSENYIITVFNAVKDKQPTWNCDTWVDKNGNQILSLYYVDPNSAKGYGSIYFNELGKEISMLGVEASLVNHYVGEAGSEENTPVKTMAGLIQEQPAEEENQPVDMEVRSIEDKQLAEYKEQLAEYEERLDKYEEKQSVGYGLQTKNAVRSIEGEDQSAEYKELLVEYKELLDEYQEAQKVGIVTPPTEPEDTKRGIGICDGIFVTVVGGVIVEFLMRKRRRRSNL
ncbi:hypothetical protein EO95_07460 [Methanosarcina sp. 1.H.T.1A.1]|uniref:hypothetical protein n=1 Tax=Methanosarcina sp. 1.H.T.1A.1 TaxID=1483602 RepID=UPI0006215F8E|nr:hypothetical protein [Methanosarcina sp. 1.H.T.1A.1]KKI00138.1 hypothetical protein EO95_07460 [Methanosarcina sp. 1.H.T.1A.1]